MNFLCRFPSRHAEIPWDLRLWIKGKGPGATSGDPGGPLKLGGHNQGVLEALGGLWGLGGVWGALTLSRGMFGAGMGTWTRSVWIGRDLEGQGLDRRSEWVRRGLGELELPPRDQKRAGGAGISPEGSGKGWGSWKSTPGIRRGLGELELHPRDWGRSEGSVNLCQGPRAGAILSHGLCGAGMGTGELWIYPTGCADQEGSGRAL